MLRFFSFPLHTLEMIFVWNITLCSKNITNYWLHAYWFDLFSAFTVPVFVTNRFCLHFIDVKHTCRQWHENANSHRCVKRQWHVCNVIIMMATIRFIALRCVVRCVCHCVLHILLRWLRSFCEMNPIKRLCRTVSHLWDALLGILQRSNILRLCLQNMIIIIIAKKAAVVICAALSLPLYKYNIIYVLIFYTNRKGVSHQWWR